MAEEFVVDSFVNARIGFVERFYGAGSVTASEAGEGKLTEKRGLESRSSRLFEVLSCFSVSAPLQRDRAEGRERVVAQFLGCDFECLPRNITGAVEIFPNFRFEQRELIGGHRLCEIIAHSSFLPCRVERRLFVNPGLRTFGQGAKPGPSVD